MSDNRNRSRQDLPRRPPRPIGDLEALRAEYASGGIGTHFLGEVRSSAYLVVGRYNAAVYSEIGNWRHGFEDLVQDIVTDSLLRDRQAQYMLDVAATMDDLRRLLARQVRRRLARRRTRTIVDNILDRARPILAAAPFDRRVRHLQTTFLLDGSDVEDRAATFQELRAGARAIGTVTQRGTAGGDRAPMVYSTVDLRRALQRLATVMPVAFTLGELDRVLRLALPHFLPSVLDFVEHEDADDIDAVIVRSQATNLLNGLDRTHRVVLSMKLAGSSDAEVGRALGISRRTATNRKAAAFSLVEDLLQPLNHAERLAVLDRIGSELRGALVRGRVGLAASTSD